MEPFRKAAGGLHGVALRRECVLTGLNNVAMSAPEMPVVRAVNENGCDHRLTTVAPCVPAISGMAG